MPLHQEPRQLNRNATPGYKEIMFNIRMDDLAHNPWGTSMAWLFAIADVMYLHENEIMPDYYPSKLLGYASIAGDWQASTLLDLLDDTGATAQDLRDVYAVLLRYANLCKLAGRDY